MALMLHSTCTDIFKFSDDVAGAIIETAEYLKEKYGTGPYPRVRWMGSDEDSVLIRVYDADIR